MLPDPPPGPSRDQSCGSPERRGECWLEWSGPPERRRVLVFQRWDPRFAEDLAQQPLSEVVLFNGNDWGDFSYLHPYKDSLRTLEVAAADDYSGLMPLSSLERLVLRAAPRTMGQFDLAAFSDLVEVDLYWSSKYPLPILQWPRLRECRLYGTPIRSLAQLGQSSTLRALRLDSCRQLSSLDGMGKLQNLRDLRVGPSAKAIDISAVGECPQLRQLRIVSRGGVANAHALARARQLERVEIDAEASYDFRDFESMTQLQTLSVRGEWAGSAAAGLLSLPNLKTVAIQPTRESAASCIERLGLREAANRHGFALSVRGGARGLLVLERTATGPTQAHADTKSIR